MLGFLKRAAAFAHRAGADDAAQQRELGASLVALPLAAGGAVPPACQAVLVGADGRARRLQAARRVEPRAGELAYAFHPGPYTVELLPFAAAPELGLRTSFAVDAPDPQAAQQRFDLYLAAEVSGRLPLEALAGQIEAALQSELAAGGLELPPCTTLDEWNAFRQGLNQLLYMRFGLTVDDCLPVDLGETRDYARELAARALVGVNEDAALLAEDAMPAFGDAPAGEGPTGERPTSPGAGAALDPLAGAGGARQATPAFDPATSDAKALRRLFLELPALMCTLRHAALPGGQDLFHQQQALLQRLDLVSVGVNTMPALGLAAPNQPLALEEQLRRARHSRRACASLDEAWALLARLRQAEETGLGALYEEAQRIVANLETDCAARRAVDAGECP